MTTQTKMSARILNRILVGLAKVFSIWQEIFVATGLKMLINEQNVQECDATMLMKDIQLENKITLFSSLMRITSHLRAGAAH